MKQLFHLSLLAAVWAGSAVLHAEEPSPSPTPLSKRLNFWPALSDARERMLAVRPPEGLEMLLAILGGSQMGPAEGWFHGGQSRFGWEWLAKRFDRDHDGLISTEEMADYPPGRGAHRRGLRLVRPFSLCPAGERLWPVVSPG
jgi:hypothetical protein